MGYFGEPFFVYPAVCGEWWNPSVDGEEEVQLVGRAVQARGIVKLCWYVLAVRVVGRCEMMVLTRAEGINGTFGSFSGFLEIDVFAGVDHAGVFPRACC